MMKCKECPEYNDCRMKNALRRKRHFCGFAKDNYVLTNAEYIRSMTDEELCDFILEKRENGHCFNDRCYVNDPNRGCDDCTLEWLKKPKENNNE